MKRDMPSRRTVLLSLFGLGAGVGTAYLYRANNTIPAPDAAAEQRFRTLQDRVLARYGVPATSKFYDVVNPTLRVHVIEAGKGEPVLFVHGGNSVAAGWIPLLAHFHQAFRVLAPDRPGCGLTTKFNYLGVPLREHAVAYIRGLMDAMHVSRTAIVGNSMGGYFALAFALAHPDRVSKLILVGEPAGSAPKIRLANRLFGTRIINSILFATILKPGRPGPMGTVVVAHPDRVPNDLVDCFNAGSVIPGAVESWITMSEGFFRPEGAGLFAGASPLTFALRPELGGLQPPTLLLWGEKDSFGPPTLGQEMARLMPNGRCDVIPDAGHLAWLDQPEICIERIRTFLDA
jgi:pimeloyl-ACP methyl ester carboxylesterase